MTKEQKIALNAIGEFVNYLGAQGFAVMVVSEAEGSCRFATKEEGVEVMDQFLAERFVRH